MKWIIVALMTVHGHPAWVQDRTRLFPTAQECAPAAAALYAVLRHGPIVCQ